ncbi:MAG: right-handed parallel beta-helix repeat-containing protein, partial [Nitrososphaerota archaeon]|nr:right-handed parallel beta-helix repeat-containing protein [Nitrososphaerota archaeon]
MRTASSASTGTRNMVVVLCVEQGQSDAIPVFPVINNIRGRIPDYFSKATFGHWTVNVLDVLVASSDGITAHAFVLPGLIGSDQFIPNVYVANVLGQADAIYNFANYDIDHDGVVDYVAFICYRQTTGTSRGTVGLPINDYYTTNDFENINGTQVQVKIDGTNFMYGNNHSFTERVNNSPERLESMMFHEMGHSLFGWPDVDHCGFTDYNHSSFGDFDVMSSGWGGFNNVSSLYNPVFRTMRGWVTPTNASGTQTFSDFDATGQIFSYSLPSNPNAVVNQLYYFTYYTKDQNNHWQANWDLPKSSNGNYAGVLTWRTVGDINNILGNCNYGDRKKMPVTLEAAHGKWDWNENNPPDIHSVNTGQADILNGLDSLQVRSDYIWWKYNPQTGKEDIQLYKGTLYQVGSASCFFDPERYRNFAFYTNPSSNEIASADESRSISPGFAMKNLRWEGGQVKADFVSGDAAYTITENTTLTAGTWYINNSVTVTPGVTLTVNSGATINFAQGASLVCNGTIAANGATFTSPSGSWSGILFSPSSTGNLQNCTISYATSPIIIDTANVTISGCTINNSSFYGGNSSTAAAIQVWHSSPSITNTQINGQYNSWSGARFGTGSAGTISGCTIQNLGGGHAIIVQGGSNPTISHNVLRNNYYHGVICSSNGATTPSINSNTATGDGAGFALYGSYGLLQANTSSGNRCGIYAQDGAYITSGSTNQKGANIITNNTAWGINATNSSTFSFGGWSGRYYMGTCNEIYGNTQWDVVSAGGSSISAAYDWWGQYPPNTSKFTVDGTSYFYYGNPLMSPEDCPFGPISPLVQVAGSLTETASSPAVGSGTLQASPASLFAFAEGAQMDGDYEIAAAAYRSLLKDSMSAADKDRALVRLFNVFQASGDTTIIADLESISQSSGALGQRGKVLLGYAYESTHQMVRAQALLNDVVSKYPSTESERQALIYLASMRYFDPSTDKVSSAALAQLVQKYGSTLDEGELFALGAGG